MQHSIQGKQITNDQRLIHLGGKIRIAYHSSRNLHGNSHSLSLFKTFPVEILRKQTLYMKSDCKSEGAQVL